jgi:hypothetical protein
MIEGPAPSHVVQPDAGSQPVAPAASTDSAASVVAALRQSLDTPQGQEYTRAMMRVNLKQRYPDLAKELGITDEEAAKFLDLLVKEGTQLASTALAMQTSGGDRAAREEMARQMAEKEQAFEAEAAAMLGGNYSKWKEYERAAATRQREGFARQQTEQLRNAVSTESDPLSDTQFNSMQAALTAEQRRIDRESPGLSMQQQVQRLPETNRRLVDVASGYLNATQLERYRRHLEQQQAMVSTMITAMDAAEGIAP